MSYGVTYADFKADPLRIDVFLVELVPWDPNTVAVETLYYSTGPYISASTDTPASQQYTPRATVSLNVEDTTAIPGTIAQAPATSGGEIRIGQLYGDVDALSGYFWNGRAIRVIHVGYSPAAGRWVARDDGRVLYDGEAASIKVGLEEAVIELRTFDARFAFPMTENALRGMPYCFRGDGTNNVVSCGSPAKLDLQDEITVEAWVYTESLAAEQVICGWAGGTAWPFQVWLDTSGYLNLADSTGTLATFSLAVSTKAWHHIALTVSGSGAWCYLYNAITEAKTSEFISDTGLLSRAALSGATFYLTSRSADRRLNGYIQEIRVWDDVRTEAEIDGARQRSLTAGEESDVNIIALWRCDDGTSNTIGDSIATEADGTVAFGAGAESDYWRPALEGRGDVTGTLKPLAYGRVESVPPILVHLPTNIYLLSQFPWSEITGVYEGGNEITRGGTPRSVFTDLETFLAATTPAGEYDGLAYAGGTYIRLGSTPSLPLTVDGKGDASGSGYVETAGQVARRILTTLGPDPLADPSELDTTSFTALDTANSSPIGIYARGDEQIYEKVGLALGSVGGSGQFSMETGLFYVSRFGGVTGSSVATLDERHIISIEPLPVDLPFYAVSLGYRPQYRTLSLEEIAGNVIANDDPIVFRLQNEYLTARVEDREIRTRHPRSGLYFRQTALALEEDTVEEAQRLLLLVGGAASAFRVDSSLLAADQIVIGDIVTLSVTECDLYGDDLTRLSLGAGTDFLVMGIVPVIEEGRKELTVWKGGS